MSRRAVIFPVATTTAATHLCPTCPRSAPHASSPPTQRLSALANVVPVPVLRGLMRHLSLNDHGLMFIVQTMQRRLRALRPSTEGLSLSDIAALCPAPLRTPWRADPCPSCGVLLTSDPKTWCCKAGQRSLHPLHPLPLFHVATFGNE